jgi:hypothetical protein
MQYTMLNILDTYDCFQKRCHDDKKCVVRCTPVNMM